MLHEVLLHVKSYDIPVPGGSRWPTVTEYFAIEAMLIMNTSEMRLLRSAELNACLGHVAALGDDWADGCANVADCDWRGQGWGWAAGCSRGRYIGTKLRSPQGIRKAMACQLPEGD